MDVQERARRGEAREIVATTLEEAEALAEWAGWSVDGESLEGDTPTWTLTNPNTLRSYTTGQGMWIVKPKNDLNVLGPFSLEDYQDRWEPAS